MADRGPARPVRARRSRAAALLLLVAGGPLGATEYVQAPGSSLAFAGEYDGEVFAGTFPGFDTRLDFDPAAPGAARLEVAIPLGGADTGNPDRDETLLGADFFDVARFPVARYRATGFRHQGGDRYLAEGILSLRGVEKPVALSFTWVPGARPVLVGKATVPRLSFGIGGGDWADTSILPDAIAVRTRVVLVPARP